MQRERESLLLEKIELHAKHGLPPVTAEEQRVMFDQLHRENARIWKRRVDQFKKSDALQNPQPLLYLKVGANPCQKERFIPVCGGLFLQLMKCD